MGERKSQNRLTGEQTVISFKIVSTSEGNTPILKWKRVYKKDLIKYVQQLSQLASNGDDSAKAKIIKIYNSYKKEVEKIESEMAEAPIQKSKVKQLKLKLKSLIMIMSLGVLKIDRIVEDYKKEYVGWVKQLVRMYDQERDQEKLIEYYEKLEKAGEQEYQYKLGMLYAEGNIAVQDIDKAIDWLEKYNSNGTDKATAQLKKLK